MNCSLRTADYVLSLVCMIIAAGCGHPAPKIPVVTSIVSPIVSPIVAPLLPPPFPVVLFEESFNQLDPARWKEVEVKGRTAYTIQELDGARSLRAYSHDGASILLSPLRFNPDTYEWLSWRWRVDHPVDGEALDRKDGSDAAARVYVYFDTSGLPWQKRNLDYVWSAYLPEGTVLTSVFSKSSKIIVAASGVDDVGQWRQVNRNIEEDYRRCFGEDPPDVVAIGVMTDADSTHTEAGASFDDLRVTREKPVASAP